MLFWERFFKESQGTQAWLLTMYFVNHLTRSVSTQTLINCQYSLIAYLSVLLPKASTLLPFPFPLKKSCASVNIQPIPWSSTWRKEKTDTKLPGLFNLWLMPKPNSCFATTALRRQRAGRWQAKQPITTLFSLQWKVVKTSPTNNHTFIHLVHGSEESTPGAMFRIECFGYNQFKSNRL